MNETSDLKPGTPVRYTIRIPGGKPVSGESRVLHVRKDGGVFLANGWETDPEWDTLEVIR